MPAQPGKTGRMLLGIGLGLAATLVVLAVHRAGLLHRAELLALDWRFRNSPTLPASRAIVHVDLDDNAMEQVGRWPWPRRRLAQLVEVLNECGARLVVLDIVLPHPEAPRFVKEGLTDVYVGDTREAINAAASPKAVLDDVELAQTIAASPNLFLGMHVDLDPAGRGRPSRKQARIDALAELLARKPDLTAGEAAGEINAPAAELASLMGPARQHAFAARIAAALGPRPGLSLAEALAQLFGDDAPPPGSETHDAAVRAYLRQRALNEMRRVGLPAEGLADLRLRTGRGVPPMVAFAKVMRHAGFVTFKPDRDGMVRRMPLLVRIGDRVYPQLAVAAAMQMLARIHGGPARISSLRGHLVLSFPDGFVRSIPVDADGFMLVNWSGDDPARHVSAVGVADVWVAREALRRNTRLARLACLQIAESLRENDKPLRDFADDETAWARDDLLALLGKAQQTEAQLLEVQGARHRELLFYPDEGRPDPARPKPTRPTPEELIAQQARIDKQLGPACADFIRRVDALLAKAKAAGKPLARIRSRRDLYGQVQAAKPALNRSLDRARRRLRERVADKVVLVGANATAFADFVPTPMHERTPGVVVHGNIVNTLLSGQFVQTTSPWLAGALVLAVGAVVSLITGSRGAIESSAMLLIVAAGYVFIDSSVWRAWTYWLVVVGPMAALLVSFGVVTTYRQFTEQRQKRQITNTFKQYLSPAMVDRLVADPSQAALGGQRRELSCLFSDLAGFTSLSERLGPEGTVNLLNRFLDGVGEIVQVRHGGTLSKYEGDGVFAFFGAPVPQADHAARAVRAALDCQEFLPEVNQRLRAEGVLPEWATLSLRIGITTGEVLVGNMGSTQRIAYTAIGDSVNLASRLEAANKSFGTRVLVNEEAWRSASDGVLGRPIGRVLVVGKTEPVSVWEPLAREQQADDALRELIEEFARGVQRYAAGDFQPARESFLAIIARREDEPARAYLRLCDEAINTPPDGLDFDGVVRLTEK